MHQSRLLETKLISLRLLLWVVQEEDFTRRLRTTLTHQLLCRRGNYGDRLYLKVIQRSQLSEKMGVLGNNHLLLATIRHPLGDI